MWGYSDLEVWESGVYKIFALTPWQTSALDDCEPPLQHLSTGSLSSDTAHVPEAYRRVSKGMGRVSPPHPVLLLSTTEACLHCQALLALSLFMRLCCHSNPQGHIPEAPEPEQKSSQAAVAPLSHRLLQILPVVIPLMTPLCS